MRTWRSRQTGALFFSAHAFLPESNSVPTTTALASGSKAYEVWAIDQSNSPGRNYGGTSYIWSGHDLENGKRAGRARAERIDLGAAAASLCLAATGALPVRPHMIAMNPAQTHAVISFVATGHVLFMNAATRLPVACFRMSAGAGGARQAHMSTPSPDGVYVTVANQNGKLFERILTGSTCGSPIAAATSCGWWTPPPTGSRTPSRSRARPPTTRHQTS